MFGCGVQWYAYVPAASVEVSRVADDPPEMMPVSNAPPSAVAECPTESLFWNTTLSPFFTVIDDCTYTKFLMVTLKVEGLRWGSGSGVGVGSGAGIGVGAVMGFVGVGCVG